MGLAQVEKKIRELLNIPDLEKPWITKLNSRR
jgi:hypothetical protein